MVLPHPDLPVINPLRPLGSRGDYNVYFGFHSSLDFLLPFGIFIIFLFFPIFKMYCLKCRRLTETENFTTATSKNGRLMRGGQCSHAENKTQFIKRDATGESFRNTLVNKLPFEMHLPGHNFTGQGTKLYKRLNPDGRPKEWSISINRVDNAAYHH